MEMVIRTTTSIYSYWYNGTKFELKQNIPINSNYYESSSSLILSDDHTKLFIGGKNWNKVELYWRMGENFSPYQTIELPISADIIRLTTDSSYTRLGISC